MFKHILISISLAATAIPAHASEKTLSPENRSSSSALSAVSHLSEIQNIIIGYVNHWFPLRKVTLGHYHDEAYRETQWTSESVINTLHFLPGLPVLARINNMPTPFKAGSGHSSENLINTLNLRTGKQEVTRCPCKPIEFGQIKITHMLDQKLISQRKGTKRDVLDMSCDNWNYFFRAICWAFSKQKLLAVSVKNPPRNPSNPLFDKPARSRGAVGLFDATGTLIHEFKHEHNAIITACAFSPDGTSLITGSQSGTITCWEVKTGKKIFQSEHIAKHDLPYIYVLLFHNDLLFAACDDGRLLVLDPQNGSIIETVAHYNYKPLTSLTISSNGQYLAASTTNAPKEKFQGRPYQHADDSDYEKEPNGDIVEIFESQQYQLKQNQNQDK